MNYQAWVASAARKPFVKQSLDRPPLGLEEVEIAVEHCGVCHSDLSMWHNEWGMSAFPGLFGHEVVGRVSALRPQAKGLTVGQRVGVGWNSDSCMHCFAEASPLQTYVDTNAQTEGEWKRVTCSSRSSVSGDKSVDACFCSKHGSQCCIVYRNRRVNLVVTGR